MNNDNIIENNKSYWNTNAGYWFGTTALPQYGVKFVTEDDLHLFGDVSGKKLLEICCGSGHSLKLFIPYMELVGQQICRERLIKLPPI